MTLLAQKQWSTLDGRYLVLLLALTVGLWLPRMRGPLDLRYDAGVYYILGTSLAEGKGYRLLNEPGDIQAIQYPPLLPALAAVQQRLLGTSDPAVVGSWLRRWFFVLSLGYVVAVYAMGRYLLPPGFALLAALITALHVQTVFLSDVFSAEIPYAVVTALFFLVAWGGPGSAAGTGVGVSRALGAGFLALAAYGLRTAGVALLAAWVGDSLLRRRWRALVARAAVMFAAVGTWQGYTAAVKQSPEYQHPAYAYQRAGYQFYNVGYLDNIAYVDPFRPELGRASAGDLGRRVWANLSYVPQSLGEAVSMPSGWWRGEIQRVNEKLDRLHIPLGLAEVALVGLSVPIAVGLGILALQGQWLFVLYALASVALIALTPWPGQFSRYLIPLTPVFAMAFLTALVAVAKPRSPGPRSPIRRTGHALLTAAVVLVLTQQVYTLAKAYTKHHRSTTYADAGGEVHPYALFYYDETWRLHDAGLDWLAAHARPGEIVAASTPHWAYLRTGLHAVMPPFEPDAGKAEQLLDGVPVSYLVVDNLSFLDVARRYTHALLDTYPDRWKLIHATVDSGPRIYRRLPDAGKNVSPSLGSK